jgi:hypothetical protein
MLRRWSRDFPGLWIPKFPCQFNPIAQHFAGIAVRPRNVSPWRQPTASAPLIMRSVCSVYQLHSVLPASGTLPQSHAGLQTAGPTTCMSRAHRTACSSPAVRGSAGRCHTPSPIDIPSLQLSAFPRIAFFWLETGGKSRNSL